MTRDDEIALDMGIEAVEDAANGNEDPEVWEAAEEFFGIAAFGILHDMEVI